MENNQQPIQYVTVSDSVYLWIKNAIIQGEFKPGEHITQEALTRKLGVSRTPVRDAMRRLEAEGLLLTKPHCGAVVFQLSRDNLKELYEIRILIEQYCAARTCLKASDEDIRTIEAVSLDMLNYVRRTKEFMALDRQFHSLLCSFSGCVNALEILNTLWNKCDSYKSIYYSLEGRVNDTLSEHARIMQHLKACDAVGIQEAVAAHLKDVVNSISSHVNFSQ